MLANNVHNFFCGNIIHLLYSLEDVSIKRKMLFSSKSVMMPVANAKTRMISQPFSTLPSPHKKKKHIAPSNQNFKNNALIQDGILAKPPEEYFLISSAPTSGTLLSSAVTSFSTTSVLRSERSAVVGVRVYWGFLLSNFFFAIVVPLKWIAKIIVAQMLWIFNKIDVFVRQFKENVHRVASVCVMCLHPIAF